MSLFQPSTKAVSAVAQEIADTVGASGDGEMTARAGRSLFAAIQHFNNKSKWDFLRTEATPITVVAPFTVTGVSASAGQSSAACPAGHGILPDDFIVGSGFGNGTRVSATAASGFGIYGVVTGYTAGVTTTSPTFTRDMYSVPSDWKAPYSARLLVAGIPLNYVGRRLYDRSVINEQNTSSTYWYDLFMVGSRGKIRLLSPPNSADILQLRYYRNMTVPTTTATADVVDIVQDYEPYLIAFAKWHFLLDKGNGHAEQAKTWMAMAQEGLVTMMRDQTQIPDEGLVLQPGHANSGLQNDMTTRWLPWEYSY